MVYSKIDNKKYFVLFACCPLVKGSTRSIICDLQRNTYITVDNKLIELLEFCQSKTLGQIKSLYENKFDMQIDNFFSKLLNEDWGFITDEPSLFPQINQNWENPCEVTNAIIDFGMKLHDKTKDIFKQLDYLGCSFIQVRFYQEASFSSLQTMLSFTKLSRLQSIEIIIPYSFHVTESEIQELLKKHLRITKIVVHSSPFYKARYDEELGCSIIYSKTQIDSHLHCGCIIPEYFTANTSLFIESQKYNTCLNRKIAIDIEGNIKNCPSMKKNYGNVSNTSIVDVISELGFRKLWFINKDKVLICQDCEFRHICTDCRAFLENPDNILSKPLKCGYNPYTGEWEDWKNNPAKKKIWKHYQFESI